MKLGQLLLKFARGMKDSKLGEELQQALTQEIEIAGEGSESSDKDL